MGFFQEFKEFAVKGNVMDMAVGIILGTAFNKIVNSLVSDVVMPPIGVMLGQVDFRDLQLVLKEATVDASGAPVAAVGIRYGLFLNSVIDFVIVAFSVFVVVKIMNRAIRMRMPMPKKTT